MRRPTTKSLLPGFLLTLGSLALVPSCADNNSSLFLVGVMALDPATCIAKPDSTAALRPGGVLDVAFRSNYTAYVLVGNQLTERGSREQLRTETSRVTLRGAEVTLTTVDGKTLYTYSTVGTGFVDASAGDVPSYAAMSVDVIPSALSTKPEVRDAGTVLAKIRVFGDTLGNIPVTSSELDFPIRICEGCLITYPSADADTTLPVGSPYMCTTAASTTTTTDEVPPCIPGQDDSFPCTACSAALVICKDPSQNPSYGPTP
ncbi:MAG TPA: hypothetical protein VER04_18685 [Polyangiaceae bacterium]|nr:hypothetical protein [Polyangiaceae bacterium]